MYLHDTTNIIHDEKHKILYDNWIFSIWYDYSYYINGFCYKDIEHYNENIKNTFEEKVKMYLIKNFNRHTHREGNYFFKKKTLYKMRIESLKIYIRCIGKLMVLYNNTMKELYRPPNGKGYLKCLERWKINVDLKT